MVIAIKLLLFKIKLFYYILTAPIRSWITGKYQLTTKPVLVAKDYYNRLLGDETLQPNGAYEIQAEEVLNKIFTNNICYNDKDITYEQVRPYIAFKILINMYKYAPAKDR